MMRQLDALQRQSVRKSLGDDLLLRPQEAAEFLGVETATLDFWRSRVRGRGPDFVRIGARQGRIRYSLRALRAYARERTETF